MVGIATANAAPAAPAVARNRFAAARRGWRDPGRRFLWAKSELFVLCDSAWKEDENNPRRAVPDFEDQQYREKFRVDNMKDPEIPNRFQGLSRP